MILAGNVNFGPLWERKVQISFFFTLLIFMQWKVKNISNCEKIYELSIILKKNLIIRKNSSNRFAFVHQI